MIRVEDIAASPHFRHLRTLRGVLAYLADNCLTYAAGSVLGNVLTSEFKINYIRPARDAQRLVAVATVVGSATAAPTASAAAAVGNTETFATWFGTYSNENAEQVRAVLKQVHADHCVEGGLGHNGLAAPG